MLYSLRRALCDDLQTGEPPSASDPQSSA
jgi:hypothetical protein